MRLTLSLDSIALLLFVERIYHCDEEPITYKDWLLLETKLKKTALKRPAGLFGLSEEVLKLHLADYPELASKIARLSVYLPNLLQQLEKLESLGISITTKYEENYPYRLKTKIKKDRLPLVIYYSGDFTLVNNPLVYVTAPNEINKVVKNNTKEVVLKLGNENYTLITTGSRGAETVAIQTQLKNGGKVVYFTTDNAYKVMKEYKKYVKNGQMLIMSSKHPYAQFDLVTAIDRNEYIYTMSEFAIVVYSKINQGATWLGAITNLLKGWCPLAVIMDDEFYGNARLVELGATSVTMDILKLDTPLKDLCIKEEEEQEVVVYDQLSIYDFLK